MARTGNLSARGKRRRQVGRSWRVASWNVRSLVEGEGPIATGAVTGKVAEDKKIHVIQHLSRLRIGVAALQEMWWFGTDSYVVDGSLVLASGRPVPADSTPCRRREGVALVLDKFCQKAWRAGGSQPTAKRAGQTAKHSGPTTKRPTVAERATFTLRCVCGRRFRRRQDLAGHSSSCKSSSSAAP